PAKRRKVREPMNPVAPRMQTVSATLPRPDARLAAKRAAGIGEDAVKAPADERVEGRGGTAEEKRAVQLRGRLAEAMRVAGADHLTENYRHGVRVAAQAAEAHVDQQPVDEARLGMQQLAQQELVVAGDAVRLVEQPARLEERAVVKAARMGKAHALQEDFLRPWRADRVHDFAGRVQQIHLAIDD